MLVVVYPGISLNTIKELFPEYQYISFSDYPDMTEYRLKILQTLQKATTFDVIIIDGIYQVISHLILEQHIARDIYVGFILPELNVAKSAQICAASRVSSSLSEFCTLFASQAKYFLSGFKNLYANCEHGLLYSISNIYIKKFGYDVLPGIINNFLDTVYWNTDVEE